MERYYRTPGRLILTDDVLRFHAIEWYDTDTEVLDDNGSDDSGSDVPDFDDPYQQPELEYKMYIFGVTEDEQSVTCEVTGYHPFYYIQLPEWITKQSQRKELEGHIRKALGYMKNPIHSFTVQQGKNLMGFENNKLHRFIKVSFNSHTAFKRSRNLFKTPLGIGGILHKFKLFESNFDPYLRFCHIKGLQTANWIQAISFRVIPHLHVAKTQLTVTVDCKNVSKYDNTAIGRFLQASFDIEVYSCIHDEFPEPLKKVAVDGKVTYPNVVYQIATTYKYYGDSRSGDSRDFLVKHLLTLKHCAPIDDPNVVVTECETELELILKFIETINKMDPDVIYTYNGDGFDFGYMVDRAYICTKSTSHELQQPTKTVYNENIGYKTVMNTLSRLVHCEGELRTEQFSSSAYGDSVYRRMGIPGRLNYDLLIHYKRGMKKYDSYKLDRIAGDILGEHKLDVKPRQIFEYYQKGDPELIRTIALYCIQDTALLQKLVDAQIILLTITQLANVTYVPVRYLITRGQTIKVLSQIMRKAREMKFIVPVTNFNEDDIKLRIDNVKLKNPTDITTLLSRRGYYKIPTGKRVKGREIFHYFKITNYHNGSFEGVTDIAFSKRNKFVPGLPGCVTITTIPTPTEMSFTGATVLEPKCGLYTDPVAIMDFASLYPTVEISRNLCFSTLVTDPGYLDIPGVNYEVFDWDDEVEFKVDSMCDAIVKAKGTVCGKQAYYTTADGNFCQDTRPVEKDESSRLKIPKETSALSIHSGSTKRRWYQHGRDTSVVIRTVFCT